MDKRLKRRHYLEREALLEAVLVGAALADKEFRDRLDVKDFQGGMKHVVECLKNPDNGLEALNVWLSNTVGVTRVNGERVLDACLRELSKNAELASMERVCPHDALLVRFHEAVERRRSTKGGS